MIHLSNPADAKHFELGERFWSDDDGVTWHRGEPSAQQSRHARLLGDKVSTATVVSIDRMRGVVVFK